jgi:transcriptional regulator with XRE-family HTH domain
VENTSLTGNRQLSLAFADMATSDAAVYRKRRGHWLRVARERAGLNLDQVAVEMGFSLRSKSTISKWEKGERDPSDVNLRHLAEVYGVPAEIFMEPDETDEERLAARVRGILGERARRGRQAS